MVQPLPMHSSSMLTHCSMQKPMQVALPFMPSPYNYTCTSNISKGLKAPMPLFDPFLLGRLGNNGLV